MSLDKEVQCVHRLFIEDFYNEVQPQEVKTYIDQNGKIYVVKIKDLEEYKNKQKRKSKLKKIIKKLKEKN